MKQRQLGKNGPMVSALGLGCMGMSDFYTTGLDEKESLATLERALEIGVTMFDTADVYGPHTNEALLGRFLKGRRDKVFLATKFGIVRDPANPHARGTNGHPDYVRLKYIYFLHWDAQSSCLGSFLMRLQKLLNALPIPAARHYSKNYICR